MYVLACTCRVLSLLPRFFLYCTTVTRGGGETGIDATRQVGKYTQLSGVNVVVVVVHFGQIVRLKGI